MEGVASIASRISDIQSRIAQLDPPAHVGERVRGGALPATPFTVALADAVVTQALATGTLGRGAAGATGPGSQAGAVGSGKGLLGAKQVPLDLLLYGNGAVPAHALQEIGATGHRLWGPAATSADAMRAAAARDGVTIGITDSYRTYETQVDLVRRKGLYSQGGLAAAPGTSMHGWGMALDLRLDARALAWMRENGGRFGFVEDTPREPWHWGYHPTN